VAWPKRKTRKLTVRGVRYLWHYSGHCPLCSEAVYTVGQAGEPFVLYIDPYSIDLAPQAVCSAIEWAVEQDWTPHSGPTRAMAFDQKDEMFVWLPANARHLIHVAGNQNSSSNGENP
jgi:hypothetical protein